MHATLGKDGILGEIKFDMTVHNFNNSLRKAEAEKFEPFWEDVYKEYFPGIAHITSTVDNKILQKQGVDRIVILENGREYRIDEKIRFENYPDFCLEYWSDFESRTPGWMDKPLAIEFLCYAFVPSKTCYVLPWMELQRVWSRAKDRWIKKYRPIYAKNEDQFNGRIYTTKSVAVPINEVLRWMSGAKKVTVETDF